MPVVDASVVVEYLIGAEHADRARERLQSFNGSLWAPHLLDAEVGHTVRRFAAQGAISASRARTALGHLAELPIIRVGHLGLLESAWALRA
ncbi:MAG TPA: type II toxin-antitoxin system VapC family toxin, partial [Solirubrobacteraceae bacterium]|nr:type II toxin-antitoxin system VapC family toxin [Solirubrobacteraceae bacterium]